MPESAQPKINEGVVIAVGPGMTHEVCHERPCPSRSLPITSSAHRVICPSPVIAYIHHHDICILVRLLYLALPSALTSFGKATYLADLAGIFDAVPRRGGGYLVALFLLLLAQVLAPKPDPVLKLTLPVTGAFLCLSGAAQRTGAHCTLRGEGRGHRDAAGVWRHYRHAAGKGASWPAAPAALQKVA